MNRLILIFILTLVLLSCNEANPRAVKAWINMSDTMVQKLMIREQPVLDSLCKIKSAAYYKSAYDSIYVRRSEEIKLLLDSIPGHETMH